MKLSLTSIPFFPFISLTCPTEAITLNFSPTLRFVIISFENIDSRTNVEELRDLDLYISEDQLVDLEAGDFYWYQLENLKVVNLEGNFHLFSSK